MLVKKKIEMWNAVELDNGNFQLTDRNGNAEEVSKEEFHAIYERVPPQHASRRQKGTKNGIQEVLANNGEIQGDSETA